MVGVKFDMNTAKLLLCLYLLFFSTILIPVLLSPASAQNSEQSGRPLTESELSHLNQHISADGTGLPEGSGSIGAGKKLYLEHCAACHGSQGEGASALELVGDRDLLTTEFPDKGIGVYWPYAPTLFEYIDRAMPPESPKSFTSAELYSLVGYLLHLNSLMAADATVNRSTLSALNMPNRLGFVDQYPLQKND